MATFSSPRYTRYLERNLAFIRDLKSKLACKRCGFNEHPAALEFHHRDPTQKKSTVPRMVYRARSLKDIQAEIDKCDVLCANCHRLHHLGKRMTG